MAGSVGGYQLLHKISSGSQASLFVAQDVANNELVCLKMFYLDTDSAIIGYKNEVNAIKKIIKSSKKGSEYHFSNNIITIHRCFTTSTLGVIVMDLLECDFYDVVVDYKLTPVQIKDFFYQLCSGIKQCHTAGVAHMDIKLENCLYDNLSGDLKITDFGNSIIFNEGDKFIGVRGTPGFVAPEVKNNDTYCPKLADVWSLGVTFFVLLTAEQPDPDGPLRSLTMEDIVNNNIPPHAVNLLSRMLDSSPSTRYSLDQVLNHPYFHEEKKTKSFVKQVKNKLRHVFRT